MIPWIPTKNSLGNQKCFVLAPNLQKNLSQQGGGLGMVGQSGSHGQKHDDRLSVATSQVALT